MRALVAVDLEDGDAPAASILADARGLLDRMRMTVDLLSVDRFVPDAIRRDEAPELAQLLETAVLRRDAELARRLGELFAGWPAEHRGETVVARSDRPADEILRATAGRDLVVVGTHGRRGLARAWLGSVAEKVVRASPIPVLVLPLLAPQRGAPRIGVAVAIGDADAENAVAEAVEWAGRLGAKVDLIHVVSPPPVPAEPDGWMSRGAWAEHVVALSRSAADRLTALLATVPAEMRGKAVVERGDPAIAVAAAGDAYLLLCVGAERRRGLGRMWLGSVAERIVRRSRIPVLVIPARA